MAKKNGKTKWIYIGLMILGMVAAVITTFVWAQADIKAVNTKADGVKEDVVELKAEGCLPARETDKGMGIIKNEMKSIGVRIDDMATQIDLRQKNIDDRINTLNTQQTAGFEAVMKKLNEK